MGLAQQLACYALWLAAVFAFAEWLRSRQVDGEWVRKAIHIGVGNIILLAWALQVPRWLGVGFSLVFAGLALLSYRVAILPSLNGVGRRSFGTCFYAISIGLLLFWFWRPQRQVFAVIGILVMTWADALAGLGGQNLGQTPLPTGIHSKKLGGIPDHVGGEQLGDRGSAAGVLWLLSPFARSEPFGGRDGYGTGGVLLVGVG